MTDDPTPGYAAIQDGRLLLRGTQATLCRWFDDRFRHMATEAGAVECWFPSTIARGTLERAGYFDAFPDGATALEPSASGGEYLLAPAVCYHAYASLALQCLDAGIVLTAVQSCFREADRRDASFGRLWEFTMREVIFVGPALWVVSQREQWQLRITDFAEGLAIRASMVPASDPFFGSIGRGKRLLQQLKGLKYELQIDVDGNPLAVASFNLHEAFFGSRFGIVLPDGAVAHSGCVAFGVERWALAYVRQHGERAAGELMR